jgi:hypothetical protein
VSATEHHRGILRLKVRLSVLDEDLKKYIGV